MTQPLKSTQFYAGNITATSMTTLYTVPVGKAVILKAITYNNQTTTISTLLIECGGVTIANVTVGQRGTSSGMGELDRWIVLPAGATIRGQIASAGQSVGVMLSGSLLYT